MIKLLLKHKADISKASLSDAIRNQDRDMVLAIIGAGADINSKNENALSLCAMKDMDKMARFLLDNGADIHAKDYSDKTALENALENDAINTARLLLEKGASKTEDGANRALRLVALRGLDQLLRPLLGRGAKVNAIGDEEDDYGHKGAYDRRFTPLVLAIKGKQARMIEELLKQGAELNLADNYIGWK
ncbi:MAG: ankyrin repeat domain-containing protein, partial [Nitrospinota bacterium]|nr:ankyrin repeat domain-containing protein [Nitrospinota bacterium]